MFTIVAQQSFIPNTICCSEGLDPCMRLQQRDAAPVPASAGGLHGVLAAATDTQRPLRYDTYIPCCLLSTQQLSCTRAISYAEDDSAVAASPMVTHNV